MQKSFRQRFFKFIELLYGFLVYYIDSYVLLNCFLFPVFLVSLFSFWLFDNLIVDRIRFSMLVIETIPLFFIGEYVYRNRKSLTGDKSISRIIIIVLLLCVAGVSFSMRKVFADSIPVLNNDIDNNIVTIEVSPLEPIKSLTVEDERMQIYSYCMTNDSGFYDQHLEECTNFMICMEDTGFSGTGCYFQSADVNISPQPINKKKVEISVSLGNLGIPIDQLPDFIKTIIDRDGAAYAWLLQNIFVGEERLQQYDTSDVTAVDVASALWDLLTLSSLGVGCFRFGIRLLLTRFGSSLSSAEVLSSVSRFSTTPIRSSTEFVELVANGELTSERGAWHAISEMLSTEEGTSTLCNGLRYANAESRNKFALYLKEQMQLIDSAIFDASRTEATSVVDSLSKLKIDISATRELALAMQRAENNVGTFRNLETAIRELRGLDSAGEVLEIAIRNQGKTILIDTALNTWQYEVQD